MNWIIQKLKPRYKISSLPTPILNELLKRLLVAGFLFLFSLIFFISTMRLQYLLYSFFILIIYIVVTGIWLSYFLYDKVYIFDGVVVDLGEYETHIQKLKYKAIKNLKRYTYKLMLEDQQIVNVVRTTNVIKKRGLKVRLYVAKDSIYTEYDTSILFSKVIYTEILAQPNIYMNQ